MAHRSPWSTIPRARRRSLTARGLGVGALVLAAQGPLDVDELASALLPDLMTVARKGNPNAASDAAVGALLLQAKLITTITAAFYSFLQTSVAIDPARPNQLEIVYANAAAFPEALRYATEGFMNQLNLRQGSKRRWTSERTAPDRIVFRMELPERLVR